MHCHPQREPHQTRGNSENPPPEKRWKKPKKKNQKKWGGGGGGKPPNRERKNTERPPSQGKPSTCGEKNPQGFHLKRGGFSPLRGETEQDNIKENTNSLQPNFTQLGAGVVQGGAPMASGLSMHALQRQATTRPPATVHLQEQRATGHDTTRNKRRTSRAGAVKWCLNRLP